MRILSRLALATALLVPAAVAVAVPAQAAPPAASCHRTTANGSLTATPVFKLLVPQKQAYVLGSAGLTCTGGTVLGANISLNTGEPIAVNCSSVIGKVSNSGSSHGTFTWTAPAHSGTSNFHAYIKVTSTAGHATTAVFRGVVNTSPANTLFAGHVVTGVIHLGKGLKPVASGGDCSRTANLKAFPVTSIAFTIN